jgi:hypothetical protein
MQVRLDFFARRNCIQGALLYPAASQQNSFFPDERKQSDMNGFSLAADECAVKIGRWLMNTWFTNCRSRFAMRGTCSLMWGLGVFMALWLSGAPPAAGQDLNPVKTGRVCQFDAGAGVTTDGSGVATWEDQSGSSHNATRVSGNPALVTGALNGRPIIQFRNNNSYLDMAGTLFAKTHFYVFRCRPDRTTWSNYGCVLGKQSDDRNSSYLFENGNICYHSNQYPDGVAKNGAALSSPFNMNPIEQYMVLKIVVNNNSPGVTSYRIGGQGGMAVDTDVAEIIGYSTTLSTDDENKVGGYLAWKYGLTTSYPAWSPSAVQWVNPGASNVVATSAKAYATLTVAGDTTADVTLYWGTADAGATNVGWTGSNVVGNVSTGLVQNVNITGLSGDTKYYYRFYGTNSFTTNDAYSAVGSFTTALNLDDFAYRMKISFTNYAGSATLTNFPALVRFNTSNNFYKGFASSGGCDLRFTSASGQRLNHELDGAWNKTGESPVWVQVPVFTNNCYIYAYWGNAALTNAAAFTTNGATWGSSYVGVWHMGEVNARDSGTLGRHGTANAFVSAANGPIGKGVQVSRAAGNGYITVTRTIADHQPADYTLSAWVYDSGVDGDEHDIIGNYNSGNGFWFGINGDQLGYWSENWAGGPNPVTHLVWHHVVVQKVGSTGYYYLDGVAGATFGGGDGNSGWNENLTLGAGGQNRHGNEAWDGALDEIRYESVSHPADWYLASYSNQISGSRFVTYDLPIPFKGIANLAASGIAANQANLNALFYADSTNYDVIVYWGPSDATTNDGAGGWAYTNSRGNYANTGLTNLTYTATQGVSENGPVYYTWRVTNANYNFWAQPSVSWTGARTWIGGADGLWSTATNWQEGNVPDTTGESPMFAGAGAGEVKLSGNSYTNSNLTFSTGDYSLTDTNGSPGFLKEGTLLNSGGANTIAVGMTVTGTAEVAGGSTLTLAKTEAFSAGQLKLNSGTLALRGPLTRLTNGLAAALYYKADYNPSTYLRFHNANSILSESPSQTAVDTGLGSDNGVGINYNGTFYRLFPSMPSADKFMVVWTGYFKAPSTGSYNLNSYWSDNAYTVYVDLNQDGVFTSNELRWEANAGGGAQGAFTLTGGALYKVALGFAEDGGGENVGFYLDTPNPPNVHENVNPKGGNQTGMWIYDGDGPVNQGSTPVIVAASSSVKAMSGLTTASLGDLTVSNGVNLTTVSGSAVGFRSTIVPPGATAIGFNTAVDTYLTQTNGVNGSSASVTITKTGTGNLILNQPGSNLGSATFAAQAGKLGAVDVDAFGGAALSLQTGELRLSSAGGNRTYANSIAVPQSSTLTAGMIGNGVAGPLTVTASGNVDISASQTLRAQGTDSYTLRLGGQITGSGTLCVSNGTVRIDDTAFDNLQVVGGTAQLNGSLTAKTLLQTGGTLSGLTGNLVISNTLWVLNSGGTIDMSG